VQAYSLCSESAWHQDLAELLTEVDVEDVKCKRLVAKGDEDYNTAALCTSCPDTYVLTLT